MIVSVHSVAFFNGHIDSYPYCMHFIQEGKYQELHCKGNCSLFMLIYINISGQLVMFGIPVFCFYWGRFYVSEKAVIFHFTVGHGNGR